MSLRNPLPLLLLSLAACSSGGPEQKEEAAPLSREIFAPMGQPVPYATASQRADFERGRQVVERVFTEADGLGPLFNVVSCTGCHQKPAAGGTSGRYRNFYLAGSSTPDGHFLPGPHNSVVRGYGIGTDVAVRPAIPSSLDVVAQRNALPFFGAGLIAEIPDHAILAGEDPDDADGDGISGRANRERLVLARFGRKAQAATIEGFVRGPFDNHLGITTDPLTEAQKRRLPVPIATTRYTESGLQSLQQRQVAPFDKPLLDEDEVPDPELSSDDLFAAVSFAMLLAPPPPDPPTPGSERGRAQFEAIGCTGCHTPSLEGPRGPIPLYSDLLLHDMGPELADRVEMWDASGTEFRTQPLWGVAAVAPHLHDGRADTLAEAIRWHGGEASASRQRFEALGLADQADLLAFLRSLGGAAWSGEGMLQPGAAVPAAGEPGGPLRALDPTEQARWVEGRRLFDRDVPLAEGLGSPFFNGDSCRSCHDRPVIGGAGTLDVTVIRAGKWIGSSFSPPFPDGNTILPRVSAPWLPRLEASYDEVERRKSPSTLGLGLVESIPEAAILANADPDDADGDGIRGRASRLADGRLGRFGWKADVPSLAEFVRDAHTHELGMSLASADGLTFGSGSDDDGIADPELAAAPLEAMTFFLQQLAPLQPLAAEEEGRAIFEAVGCGSCHMPSLAGVPLFSDLLLHDVASPAYRGIPTANAGGREFRTPPLWGLSRTGPWMHDAGAATIEAAIYRHSGEALAVRNRFDALSTGDRAALLAFLEAL